MGYLKCPCLKSQVEDRNANLRPNTDFLYQRKLQKRWDKQANLMVYLGKSFSYGIGSTVSVPPPKEGGYAFVDPPAGIALAPLANASLAKTPTLHSIGQCTQRAGFSGGHWQISQRSNDISRAPGGICKSNKARRSITR